MFARWLRGIDGGLLASVTLLCLIALPVLVSALRGVGGVSIGDHLIRLGIAAAVCLAASRVDYRRLSRFSAVLFLFTLLLSVYATAAAGLRAGTRRWLDIGLATIQPGELAKLALVLLLAHLISAAIRDRLDPRAAVAWFACTVGLVLAVATQPDLGSAAVLAGVACGMVVIGGAPWRRILPVAGVAALSLPLMWFFGLREYQKQRILSFLNPESDPLGASYQSRQAAIAVGSGQLTGTGWLQGSQTGYEFLPAPHTDFVFAVLAEEFGFVGVLVVLGLYVWLGHTILTIGAAAAQARDSLGGLICGGLFLMLFLQALYNIAMVAGLVPVKGFPLPFLSYGGNSLLVTGAAVGLVAAVRRHTFLS